MSWLASLLLLLAPVPTVAHLAQPQCATDRSGSFTICLTQEHVVRVTRLGSGHHVRPVRFFVRAERPDGCLTRCAGYPSAPDAGDLVVVDPEVGTRYVFAPPWSGSCATATLVLQRHASSWTDRISVCDPSDVSACAAAPGAGTAGCAPRVG